MTDGNDEPEVKTIPPEQHPADKAFDEVADQIAGDPLTHATVMEALDEMRRRWKEHGLD